MLTETGRRYNPETSRYEAVDVFAEAPPGRRYRSPAGTPWQDVEWHVVTGDDLHYRFVWMDGWSRLSGDGYAEPMDGWVEL